MCTAVTLQILVHDWWFSALANLSCPWRFPQTVPCCLGNKNLRFYIEEWNYSVVYGKWIGQPALCLTLFTLSFTSHFWVHYVNLFTVQCTSLKSRNSKHKPY